MEQSSFFKKTAVLTVSNVLTGTLTFIYTIFLSREMGAAGMGLYQLVTPVFALFLCITGGGITVTLSKIAAEKKASGKLHELYKTVKIMCMFELVWSLMVTLFLIILSKVIANNILSDSRTVLGIIAFCPALIIISLSSVFKGTYYGLQRILEPAIIDVIEKAIRIIMIFPLMALVKNMNLGIEYTTAAAMLVVSIGEIFSFILFFISYKIYIKNHPARGICKSNRELVVSVLRLAIPLALNGILSTIFSMILTLLIPKRLMAGGVSYNEAISLLGKLEGMTLTILFYPAIILNAVCTVLIPSISEAVTSGKDYIINHRTNIAIKVASIVGFSSTVLILTRGGDIGIFFYKDSYVGYLLSLLSIPLPIVYIQIISFSILNGLGRQGSLLINSTLTSISDVIFIYIFLGIPTLAVKGYALNFLLSALFSIGLNFSVIRKSFKFKLDYMNCIVIPCLCAFSQYALTSLLFSSITNVPLIIVLYYLTYFILYLPFYFIAYKNKNIPNFTRKAS
ncbi:stage V sporulation protein B [Clostridium cylindrosporum]|uniref:Stage V sporulation protein B n=1 Tax=Clostridium cylindrosporum DSM 605 TaxID=1121307 RepID=A0A0J8DES4_CLOCY|nr:stage V sporulation protein B [Clostridium cylindrosporum]KMT22734.1 stage V sporulation protein B [Clostridium cylindrosporum DSM 605]